ncbi:DUF6816 family protein [Gloeobacter kilaueensis]|uniref:DUF6816 domain-containing protein n=1 Tax=Gloeobacter kilaueensis (strain ATCC BAA-2537 / CCAP 1431/1 / ULC 316 / JS1) TaxID=1183438 RepID=U5QSD3_GLOK1|nr:hypothetical protein [Gloeobacter kilaueensis]AGY60635.1 hypothetical protein GKIL_4389 [Gloeobacter kilaueensis JS1]
MLRSARLGGIALVFWLQLVRPAAATLAERLRSFPAVGEPLPLPAAQGALVYPAWFEGTWQVRTTLVDLAAPLGKKVIDSQAFAASRQLRGKPITFLARFVRSGGLVVADLAFNDRSIAEAYFGRRNVLGVEVRPQDPNRQVLRLRGNQRGELLTLRRQIDKPTPDRFDVGEYYQQIFTGSRVPSLRGIETVTLYSRTRTGIGAEQMTAVYLDPREPAYFEAGGRAVSAYRYRLEFRRVGR